MIGRTVGVVVAVVAVAACADSTEAGRPAGVDQPPTTIADAPEPVTETRSMDHDGVERSYRLHVPDDLPAGARPLVVGLHGGLGSADGFAQRNGFEEAADTEGFIAVSPNGTTNAAGEFRTWNGGYCCGPAMLNDVDDVGFVAAVLDEVEDDYDVDVDRVFVMGHSNGGIMAYRLACELSDRIAAIGVVAGSLGGVECDPSTPVSLLHIHGDDDRNHPLDGGVGPRGISGVDFNSAVSSVDTLAAVDSCGDPTTVDERDELVTTSWTDCADGVEVRFLVVVGGSHAWPGGAPSPLAEVTGESSDAVDATSAISEFFDTHGR